MAALLRSLSILPTLYAIGAAQSSSSATPISSRGASATVSQSSAYSESGVPTGTAIAGNYAGPLRPQVHFSPPVGFMNDPNGMFVDANGTYHLYYQYNPTANVAGNQHWGHATSNDLYTWTNQRIALFPGAADEGIFSGSAVVDSNNTSGFFPNQTNGVVAIYTLNVPDLQDQHIAYSTDGGYEFTKYEGNPVLSPGGTNSNQFRDPKVIWYAPTSKWIMVVAYPVDFAIGIFSSSNLIDWTPESNFTDYGLSGLQYECPNLVEMPVLGGYSGSGSGSSSGVNTTSGGNSTTNSTSNDNALYVLLNSINPGAPLGGSITQYYVGTFNSTHFIANSSRTRLTDFGKDDYAGQFFYGIGGSQDQITLNWASNWQYTNVVPTAGDTLGDGFRSAMTVPRGHYLKELPRFGMSLISYPYNIMSIVESELASNDSLSNGTVFLSYADVQSGALYFEANITGLSSSASLQGSVNFTFSSSVSGEYVTGGTFINSGDIWLDRGHTNGFDNPYFSDKFSATGLFNPSDASWRISGIIDRSIIELFLNGGELSSSSVFFPTRPLDIMALSVGGINSSAQASVAVYSLKAAWLDQADANGTVSGNTTAGGGNATTGFANLGAAKFF